jgi:hypothetical protein
MSAFGVVILIAVWLVCAFAHAGTLTCSTWNDTKTCYGPHGYLSRESTWNDRTTGSDNEGNEWSITRWHDQETITTRRKGQ